MPTARKRKKTSRKKSDTTKPSDIMRAQIHEAVEAIPTLIAHHVPPEEHETTTPHRQKLHDAYRNTRQKKRLVWACVSLVALVVLGMWYWNAHIIFTGLTTADGTTDQIMQNASDNVEAVLNQISLQQQVQSELQRAYGAEQTREDIEAILRETIAPAAAAAATPTTTASTTEPTVATPLLKKRQRQTTAVANKHPAPPVPSNKFSWFRRCRRHTSITP